MLRLLIRGMMRRRRRDSEDNNMGFRKCGKCIKDCKHPELEKTSPFCDLFIDKMGVDELNLYIHKELKDIREVFSRAIDNLKDKVNGKDCVRKGDMVYVIDSALEKGIDNIEKHRYEYVITHQDMNPLFFDGLDLLGQSHRGSNGCKTAFEEARDNLAKEKPKTLGQDRNGTDGYLDDCFNRVVHPITEDCDQRFRITGSEGNFVIGVAYKNNSPIRYRWSECILDSCGPNNPNYKGD